MPTYEFRCPDGTIVERFYKMSEVPDTIPSPDGNGEAVRVISGGAGFLFKGDGFYITDYGKDGKKDQRKAASGETTKSDSSSGASSSSASGSDSASSTATPAAPAKSSTDPKAA
ncbi:MAG: hypothetical protein MUF00_07090 [Gemmatimonadaceae bacterium]|jgi:putative FmdB family regulatory protein|nr:hypothetical protein [Gemmatimonadaceae bacterium]